MKTFLISLLALFCLIGGILTYSAYLTRTEKGIVKEISEISDCVYNQKWKDAENKTRKLIENWEKTEKILSMFNDHGDLDEITLAISDMKESVSNQDEEHSYKAIAEIKILLERLKKNEEFSIENVLALSHCSLSCHNML